MSVRSDTYVTERHRCHYLCAGEVSHVPIIFVHGWPELSLSWRHQLPYFADLGYRAIAPDMRGYGKSSVYRTLDAYAQEHVVKDLIDLADGLDIDQAIWVGHDWGAATVSNIARHHADRCLGVANLCVPYHTIERGWAGLLPYVDRALYPEDEFPGGQWEYQFYYEEHFDEATRAFDADPGRLVKLLFRKGDPDGAGQRAGTAMTRKDGGWFGGGEMPKRSLDSDVVTEQDVIQYADALRTNSFFGPDAYYMNHGHNADYVNRAERHELDMPVLFLHARYDQTCETLNSRLAEPMRQLCSQLTEATLDTGHWMAQEAPLQVNRALEQWLASEVSHP